MAENNKKGLADTRWRLQPSSVFFTECPSIIEFLSHFRIFSKKIGSFYVLLLDPQV